MAIPVLRAVPYLAGVESNCYFVPGSTLRDALPTSSIFQPSFLNFSSWRRVSSTMFPLETEGLLWAGLKGIELIPEIMGLGAVTR